MRCRLHAASTFHTWPDGYNLCTDVAQSLCGSPGYQLSTADLASRTQRLEGLGQGKNGPALSGSSKKHCGLLLDPTTTASVAPHCLCPHPLEVLPHVPLPSVSLERKIEVASKATK